MTAGHRLVQVNLLFPGGPAPVSVHLPENEARRLDTWAERYTTPDGRIVYRQPGRPGDLRHKDKSG